MKAYSHAMLFLAGLVLALMLSSLQARQPRRMHGSPKE